MLLRLLPINPVPIGKRQWRTFIEGVCRKTISDRREESGKCSGLGEGRRPTLVGLQHAEWQPDQVSVIFGRRVGRTLSPQFGLDFFPKAPQAFPRRLGYGLACYPEPALPPVGAEFFPVAGPHFSTRPRTPSRGVLNVDLKLG
jgi:hypothetical protein